MERPGRLMVVGVVGLVIGAVLPFLMVIRVIEPTLLLSIVSYVASVAGLFLGLMGAFTFARNERAKRRDPWEN